MPSAENKVASFSPTTFFAQCAPAIRSSVDVSGLMSQTNLEYPKPDELTNIFTSGNPDYNWRNMKDLFMWRLTINALGIKRYGLFDLLADNAIDMSAKLSAPENMSGEYEVKPYIWARREEPINNQSWNITGGRRCLVDGTPDGAGGYWLVTISSPGGVPNDEAWWLIDSSNPMFVQAVTVTDGGIVSPTQWQVIKYSAGTLVLKPAMGASPAGTFDWGATNPNLTPPVIGELTRGVNNVSEFEPYCYQPPGLLSNQLDPFWIQFSQDAFNVSESYRLWQARLLDGNPLYKEFYDLPEARYRVQAAEDFKMRLAEQFFFGQPYDSNQTLSLYRDLPKTEFKYPSGVIGSSVTAGATEYVSRKANAVGIYWQHYARGRVIDIAGQKFNMAAFIDVLYMLTRYRRDIGMPSWNTVEVLMPKAMYPTWNAAMIDMLKDQTRGTLMSLMDLSPKQDTSMPNVFFKDYPLQYPPGVTLRVVFHDAFDDILMRRTSAGIETAGRQLWILPWKYNRMGIINTKKVSRMVGDIEKLAQVNPQFQCQISGRKRWIELINIGWTAVCNAPQAGLIFQGLGQEIEPISRGSVDYTKACSVIP
jgi:hypothetical protein